jgi:antitoxin component YwqK of YwqJK toxin-antitoxin module
MRFKKNIFPIIDIFPNPGALEGENEWESLGDRINSKVSMNDHGKFHGTIQTFSNGKLLEERQYKDGKVFGFSVYYGARGVPLSAWLVTDKGSFAKFTFFTET